MNVVVVGAGLIGARHIDRVRSHARCNLVGVVEPNSEVLADGQAVFRSLDDVDADVDVAICAVPTQLHASVGAQCARRGWAVLMEKPVAETVTQADDLINACRGVPLLVGHHRRHHQLAQKTKQLLADGAIGNLIAVTGLWAARKPDSYFEGNWRSGSAGSPISINMVHDLDLLRFMVGDVNEVVGLVSQHGRERGVQDSAAIALRFSNGALGTFVTTDAGASPWNFEAASGENPNIAASGQDCYQFIGIAGSLRFPSLTLWEGSTDWSEPQSPRKIEVEAVNPLDAQLDHLIEVVLNGATPLSTGEDARKTLALVEAVSALGIS